jgi:peroxin-5
VNWESEFKAQEQSWANEFKQQEEAVDAKTELASVASKLVASVEGETNPKFKESSFFQFMKKLSKQELSIEGNKLVEKAPISGENWASEFSQRQNNNNWASEFTNNQTTNSWTQEFNGNTTSSSIPKNGERTHSDWATDFQKTDNQINDDDWVKNYSLEESIDQTMADLQRDWEKYKATSSGYLYNYNDYEFSQNNPFLDMPNLSSMKGQNLAESILILEAKVQLDPNDAHAWYQLGTRQQENEQEPKAIAALRKASTLNPQILDSWLSLAVSYTNEFRRDDVYDVLESWFEHNSKYKKLLEQQRAKANFIDPHEFFTDLFIQAALLNPGENLDPDVQIGLGILYNVSEEYDKAVDCFQTALSLRPNVSSIACFLYVFSFF